MMKQTDEFRIDDPWACSECPQQYDSPTWICEICHTIKDFYISDTHSVGINCGFILPTPNPSQEGNLSVMVDEFPSWEGLGVGFKKLKL